MVEMGVYSTHYDTGAYNIDNMLALLETYTECISDEREAEAR